MEDQKHYIIVDNETYELYDGNGSFYVTKANHSSDQFPVQKSFCSAKEADNSFVDNLIVPISTSDTNASCCSGQQHLEPIIIDDYSNMNYFTQAASDVTIYLNTHNENNFMQNTDRHSGYFVDSEGVIDLTKVPTDCRQTAATCAGVQERESIMDLNKTIQNLSNEELDAPEFIDISKLKLSYIDIKSDNSEVLPVMKRTHRTNCKTLTADSSNEKSDEDDEVIFVKEFKVNDKASNSRPLDLRRRPSNDLRQKSLPEPRRNPKRQVQLIKESFDLALKLSDEEIYYGKPKKSSKEHNMENSRRSNRNTGAVLSPPVALTNEDYKEWPAEGLHERPVFNMATKKIEKFDFKLPDDRCKTSLKKNNANASKAIKNKQIGKKGKRRTPNRVAKNKKESPEKGISKEFALLTHETLQEVIKYVSQVKEYNEIRRGSVCDTKHHATTGSIIADAKSLLNLVRSNSMEKNLNDAVDILTDSCILYSLANDVCQVSVAKYLKSVKDN